MIMTCELFTHNKQKDSGEILGFSAGDTLYVTDCMKNSAGQVNSSRKISLNEYSGSRRWRRSFNGI